MSSIRWCDSREKLYAGELILCVLVNCRARLGAPYSATCKLGHLPEEAKTAAKNRLKYYCLTMLRILTLSLSAEKLQDKFEACDTEQFEVAVQGALDWLKENQRAEKDEFEWKGTQVEGVVIPILHKVYDCAQ